MASTSATLIVLFVAVVCFVSGAVVGTASSALDQVCESLGGSYVTPKLCTSALCYDAASPCRDARDYAAVASLAARLLARNATATRDSVATAASANATADLKSCLQLYDGLVPALEWAAASVAAGRAYAAARELMQATRYAQRACAGIAGAELPRENGGFVTMAIVAHAVLSTSVAPSQRLVRG